MQGFVLGSLVVLAAAAQQITGANVLAPAAQQVAAPNPDAPPVVDIALRQVRSSTGGSSIARSMVRENGEAFLYAGLGPCIVGASESDRANENSLTWRVTGTVRSVAHGIAVADVEWQRIEYRNTGVTAGPRVRTTLTLPLGERVAVDFAETPNSQCRSSGLVFEVGVAPDHGRRLAMSAEGRLDTMTAGAGPGGAGGGGGGGRGVPDWPDQIERRRQGAEASRAANTVTRPMPPRQYNVDLWLVPPAPDASPKPALSQRLSQVVGGTGGRFVFPPIVSNPGSENPTAVEISALVIPVNGEQVVVAISRYPVASDGPLKLSAGWLKVVRMPKPEDVIAFEIPGADLRLKITMKQ